MKHVFKNTEKVILQQQARFGLDYLFDSQDRAVIYDILRYRFDGAFLVINPIGSTELEASVIRPIKGMPFKGRSLINQELLQYSFCEGIERLLCTLMELVDEERALHCFGPNCGRDYFCDPDPLAVTLNWSKSVKKGKAQVVHHIRPKVVYGWCGELAQRYWRFIYSVAYVAALTPWLDETDAHQIWIEKLEENGMLADESLIRNYLDVTMEIVREVIL